MNTPITEILMSNTSIQLKEPRLFGEMDDSKTEAGNK